MKKNIFLFIGLLLVLGFLIFNYSNRPAVVTPLGAAFACPPTCIAPTVITSSASSITTTEAQLNGETTSSGGGNLFEVGFEYGLTTSYGSTVTETPAFPGAGTFSSNVTSLACGKTYHYRAFASNQQNTHPVGYGGDLTFNTDTCSHYSTGRNNPSSSAPSTSTPPPASPSTASGTTPPSSGNTPPVVTVPPTSPCSIASTLVFGSTGNEVRCLQGGLNTRINLNLAVDGIFGKQVKAAVIKFQLENGLTGDGIFGIKSRAAWEK